MAAFRRRERRAILIGVLVALVLGGAVVAAFLARPPAEGVVKGRVVVTLPGGREELVPIECVPSRRLGGVPEFFGVGLLGPEPRRLALIVAREAKLKGWIKMGAYYLVLWRREASGAWVQTRLDARDCTRFELDLSARHAGRSAQYPHFYGEASALCRKGSLGLEAQLEFEHCPSARTRDNRRSLD